MEDGADGEGDGSNGTKRGVEFGLGESLGSSGAGGTGGSIPPIAYLLALIAGFLVWAVLSLL